MKVGAQKKRLYAQLGYNNRRSHARQRKYRGLPIIDAYYESALDDIMDAEDARCVALLKEKYSGNLRKEDPMNI